MSKEVHPIDPQLAINLRIATANLKIAQKNVEDAQVAIYNAGGDKIPPKGTVHLTGVKVATGYTDKWDQVKLAVIEGLWPSKSNLPFPFKKEFKADGKAVSYIRDNTPEAYAILEDALTQTPKKPTFELEE